MKRFTKLLIVTAAMTMLLSVPVFATEKTLDAEVNMITQHVKDVETQVDYLTPKSAGFKDWDTLNAHRRTVMYQVLTWASDEFDNYILYLQKEEALSQEDVRIKQQNIVAIGELCKVNPAFNAQLAPAQADLAVAQQNVINNQTQIALCKQYKAEQIQYIKAKAASYK